MLVSPVGIAAKSLPTDLTGVNKAFKAHHKNGKKDMCPVRQIPLSAGKQTFTSKQPPRLNQLYLDNLQVKRYILHSPEQNT